MNAKITQQTQDKILELSQTMSYTDIAKKLKIQPSTVSQYVNREKNRVQELQNNLNAEHADLDADIAFELSNLTQYSDDTEKSKLELLDEFSEAFGITLKPVNESIQNKSEFLDFLKSKAYEMNY